MARARFQPAGRRVQHDQCEDENEIHLNAPRRFRRLRYRGGCEGGVKKRARIVTAALLPSLAFKRSEEHTSELQSLRHLVCRLLLEKKKNIRQSRLLPAELTI